MIFLLDLQKLVNFTKIFLNISHGTIAQSFNKFDVLYKKVIAEGVFLVLSIISLFNQK